MKRVIVALAVLASAAAFAQAEEPPAEESAPAVEAPPAADEPATEAPPPARRRRQRAPKAAAPKKRVEARPRSPAPAPEAKAAQEPPSVEDLAKQAEQQAATPGSLDGTTPQQRVEQVARQFFLNLTSADARSLIESCAVPFVIEDRRFTDQSELFQEWLKRVRSSRVDLLVLYGIDVLSPEQMEEHYGPPPARLANFPWKASGTWIAVANLSGRPAVAVLKQVGENDFRVVAYTD